MVWCPLLLRVQAEAGRCGPFSRAQAHDSARNWDPRRIAASGSKKTAASAPVSVGAARFEPRPFGPPSRAALGGDASVSVRRVPIVRGAGTIWTHRTYRSVPKRYHDWSWVSDPGPDSFSLRHTDCRARASGGLTVRPSRKGAHGRLNLGGFEGVLRAPMYAVERDGPKRRTPSLPATRPTRPAVRLRTPLAGGRAG
jgi:hypothetical protein